MDVEHFIIVFSLIWKKELQRGGGHLWPAALDARLWRALVCRKPATGDGPGSEI